jgi:uncharacterized protein YdhG (YjbR/CyaY superfamily)
MATKKTASSKKPETIDEYLLTLPQPAQRMLRRVRNVIAGAVPDAVQSMSYGIPTFTRAGKPLLYFAAWKQHWSLYPVSAKELAELGSKLEVAEKGTLKLSWDDSVPVHLIAALAMLKAGKGAEASALARAPSAARPR